MPRLRLLRRRNPEAGRLPAALLLGAGLYASVEIASGLLIGRFFDWGRAEPLLFFAFRPFLLLIAVWRMANAPWRRRYFVYSLALLLAGLSETLLLEALGAFDPWPDAARGFAAGLLLSGLFDGIVQLGKRWGKRRGRLAAGLLLFVALLVPGALRPYERIVLGPSDDGPGSTRPVVTVMTSLPIAWGEEGPFDPAGRPSASWRSLEREFALRPIDYLDDGALGEARLALIAQPRLLAPEELVALDSWVRRGGRALILADAVLIWPSALPAGDVRRPAASNMLAPLLDHWGIRLEPPAAPSRRIYRLGSAGELRQLWILGGAKLTHEGAGCRREADFVLDCRIGSGRAIVVGDADLLHDSTSLPPGASEGQRHNRLSDNQLIVADWLDHLAAVERQRIAGSVQWADPQASRTFALAVATLPIAIACLGALLVLLMGRRRDSPTYPQP